MNRDILFRGKPNGLNHQEDNIVYGDFVEYVSKHFHDTFIIEKTEILHDKQVSVHPDSVQQYIGIEIDGKKVFEGDELMGLFYGEQDMGIVTYLEDRCCFAVVGDDFVQTFDSLFENDLMKYLKKL